MLLHFLKKHKFLLTVLGAVVIIVLSVYLFGLAILNGVLRSAIGVPVSLGKMRLKLFPIEVGLYDIHVRKFGDFKSQVASIPEIFISVEPFDLLKGKIHVRQIRINLEEIVAERDTNGKINLNELQKKLAEKPRVPPPPLQIDKVTLTMTRAQYIDYGFTPPITKVFFLNVYNASLEDVTNPRRVTEQVIAITLKKIGMKMVTSQVSKMTASFAEQTRASLSGLLGAKN